MVSRHRCLRRLYLRGGKHSAIARKNVHHEPFHLLLLEPVRSGKENSYSLLPHPKHHERKHSNGDSKRYRHFNRSDIGQTTSLSLHYRKLALNAS
jgi:hypothetical protein